MTAPPAGHPDTTDESDKNPTSRLPAYPLAVKRIIVITTALAASALAGTALATPQQQATRLVRAAGGEVGVSIRCDERTVEVNATRRQRAASTLKVAVALAAIRAEGLDGPQVTADPELRAMIIDSDNDAANAVIARGGNFTGVRELMSQLGMRETNLDIPYGQGITTMGKATTAHDLRILADALNELAAAGTGTLADLGFARSQGQALVQMMERVGHPGLFTGSGAKVAHKSGWLPGAENDLAIVRFPGRRACTVGIVTDGPGTYGAQVLGSALMRDVIKPLSAGPERPAPAPAEPREDGIASGPTSDPRTDAAGDLTVVLARWLERARDAIFGIWGGPPTI